MFETSVTVESFFSFSAVLNIVRSSAESPRDDEELRELLLGLHRRMDAFDGRLQDIDLFLSTSFSWGLVQISWF